MTTTTTAHEWENSLRALRDAVALPQTWLTAIERALVHLPRCGQSMAGFGYSEAELLGVDPIDKRPLGLLFVISPGATVTTFPDFVRVQETGDTGRASIEKIHRRPACDLVPIWECDPPREHTAPDVPGLVVLNSRYSARWATDVLFAVSIREPDGNVRDLQLSEPQAAMVLDLMHAPMPVQARNVWLDPNAWTTRACRHSGGLFLEQKNTALHSCRTVELNNDEAARVADAIERNPHRPAPVPVANPAMDELARSLQSRLTPDDLAALIRKVATASAGTRAA